MKKILKYILIVLLVFFCYITYKLTQPVEIDMTDSFDEFFDNTFDFVKPHPNKNNLK